MNLTINYLCAAACAALSWGFLRNFPIAANPWSLSAPRTRYDRGWWSERIKLIAACFVLGVCQLFLHVFAQLATLPGGSEAIRIPASCPLFPLTLAVLLYLSITRNPVVFGWVVASVLFANTLVVAATCILRSGQADWIAELVPADCRDALWSRPAMYSAIFGTLVTLFDTGLMVGLFWFIHRCRPTWGGWKRVATPLLVAITIDAFLYPIVLWVFQKQDYSANLAGHLLCELFFGILYSWYVYHPIKDSEAVRGQNSGSGLDGDDVVETKNWTRTAKRQYAPKSAKLSALSGSRQVFTGTGPELPSTPLPDSDSGSRQPLNHGSSVGHSPRGPYDRALQGGTFLNELTTPPEVAAALAGPAAPARVVADIKQWLMLSFYYGGSEVLCRDSDCGLVVIAHGSSDHIRGFLDTVPDAAAEEFFSLFPQRWQYLKPRL